MNGYRMNRCTRLITVAAALVGVPLVGLATLKDVAINEIAWAGNAADHTDEWIELVNTSDRPIDLDGWRLTSSDGAPDVLLYGMLAPRNRDHPEAGYVLLERDDDGSVPSLPAGVIYTGALTDKGESLLLYDSEDRLVDAANLSSFPANSPTAWPSGTGAWSETPPRTMERVDPLLPDAPDNWATCVCLADSIEAGLFCGTPGRENSAYNVPPIAHMEIVPRFPQPRETVRFDAAASTDENDEIVSFQWDFGDGSTADGQTANHVYAVVGEYEIVLTARDGKGGSTRLGDTLSVHALSPPLADFSVVPPDPAEPLRAGDLIVFLDESAYGPGGLSERRWAFGDGTIEQGERVTHEFASAGSYVVRLAIVDARGYEAARSESIAVASRTPEARFTISPERPNDGEPALFDASASGDPDGEIASFHWDFDGDGTTDQITTHAQTEHAFEIYGYHAPQLIVEDIDGDRSDPRSASIYVNAGPVAQFTLSTFEPRELEDVEFVDCSHDRDGTIRSWLWDFDDGDTSVQTSAVHAFRSSGTRTVTLTVFDDQSASRTASATIAVINLAPVAALSVDSRDEQTGVPFAFDASGSSDPSPDGGIAGYEWDLDGDGTYDRQTSASTLCESYDDDGIYCVTVRVTDDRGDAAVSEPVVVTVRNRPPSIASIHWAPEHLTDGNEVTFSAEAEDPDGEIVDWEWVLGDEETATCPTPIHAFARTGVHRVTLVVRDNDNVDSEVACIAIDVANSPPIAEFSFAETAPWTVAFDARGAHDPSPSGQIVHIAWDFGDGSACPEGLSSCGGGDRATPIHHYASPGTYTVTLVVIDDDGAIGRSHQTLTIH